MPEIKNNFLQGKMNQDLDERLLPNGQYRDAHNVEVSTSESSDVGTVKNVLGNHRMESIIDTDKFICVGSAANEKTNKLYWFVSSYDVDAIVEYDVTNDIAQPVLVDTKGGTFNAVLKFTGNIITGINIIDDLLFWTDNNGEPKKINIKDCKNGTTDMSTHTQLSFQYGSFYGVTLDKVAPDGDQGNVDFLADPPNAGAYFFVPPRLFVQAIASEDSNGDQIDINGNIVTAGNFNYDIDTGQADGVQGTADGYVFVVRHYRQGEFLGKKEVRYFGSTTEEAVIQPGYIGFNDGTHGRLNAGTAAGAGDQEWEVGDILFGDDINIDIEERHITVIRKKPLNVLSAKINHSDDATSTSNIPNLFETKLPRFSYRYKYVDGEYSAFAPFTPTVFNPKYPKDTSVSSDTNIFYNSDNAYDIKEPYNKAMVNSIHSVNLSGFVTYETPEDVIEIDILYKQEEAGVIYSIDTIKQINSEWHLSADTQGSNIGYNTNSNQAGYSAKGSYTKGSYLVTTENIYAALPANQLLRPWDNVPKKALAQEVTANRIVYGNYVQNYDILEDAEVSISYSNRQTDIGSFESQGLPSIKSQRNYQIGVVYCDEFGRETPVFTSKNGAVIVPWSDSNGNLNASKTLQLNASVTANFPEWVDSLKFFIKENSNPYYNLTMERAWVRKSTYELDNSEGHLYISFPSSDRNKISEEDYIILKKKIGTGEEQITTENKFKVIDIKNEAPDVLKYQLINMGAAVNSANSLTALFSEADERIDKEVDTVLIDYDLWKDSDGFRAALEDVNADDDGDALMTRNLYISWRRIGTDNSASKKYKVIGGYKTDSDYVLKLLNPITQVDADIAHINSDSSDTAQINLHPDLTFQIHKNERRETEDFSGKFFVKISQNYVTDSIVAGNPVNVIDQHLISSKTSSWYWQDDVGANINTNSANYGLTNYAGYNAAHTSTDSIQDTANNTVGDVSADTGVADSDLLYVSDYAAVWDGIKTEHGPTFFIDSMHMAAGQSQTSNYAKYSCITWAGLGGIPTDPAFTATSTTESAWSYPPLKTWLADFDNISNLITPQNTTVPSGSIWYEDDMDGYQLISTSPVITPNPDYYDLAIDGWVGPLQNVSRYDHDSITEIPAPDHVNGLEGLVTTTDVHATGPRKWFSGITGDDTGVGADTHVYSSENGETGRHFMHLSFFAPGKDLHDASWDASPTLYGVDSWAAGLQGIWGGGVFTGEQKEDKFGSDAGLINKHFHLAMEGNYAVDNSYLPQTPGPGTGFGYDISYKELHERQWDPTFNSNGDPDNKIRDFVRNLYPGAQFRFNKITSGSAATTDTNIYTIKDVSIKKLYNHTSWRKPYNRHVQGEGYEPTTEQDIAYQSVEEVALKYLDKVDAQGDFQGSDSEDDNLKNKIADFGKASNRRLCYIIELDQNPADNDAFGVAGEHILSAANKMTADITNGDFCDIEFLDPVQSILLSDLNKFPAIWEIDPKKKDVDLDIYFEASNSIPVKLNNRTNELFAPVGCRVEILDSSIGGTSILESWDGATALFSPGFIKGQGQIEINYNDVSFKFIREDGSYTIAESGPQSYDGQLTGFRTSIVFREEIADVISSGLSWYNCFSFGNGIESNRIRDDFNEIFITNGVKASTTTQEPYKEEQRPFGLIYSGLYNSNSGVNDLNQFIMAEKITKDLNPTYGSIQKLFQRRISLIAFCEDRVISITSDKDVLFNADGNSQLVASNRVLGDATPFLGNYGISKNPESFASESYRAYFTDKQRGAVLRLSKDGLTPISKTGMQDFFRDNLPKYNTILGTYDSYKENYNVTLSNNANFNENFILDSYFLTGEGTDQLLYGSLNKIENPLVFDGSPLQFLYDQYNVLDTAVVNSPFTWDGFTDEAYDMTSYAVLTHHAEIPEGSLQPYVEQDDTVVIGTPYRAANPWRHVMQEKRQNYPSTQTYQGFVRKYRLYNSGTNKHGPPGFLTGVGNGSSMTASQFLNSLSSGQPAYACGYWNQSSGPLGSPVAGTMTTTWIGSPSTYTQPCGTGNAYTPSLVNTIAYPNFTPGSTPNSTTSNQNATCGNLSYNSGSQGSVTYGSTNHTIGGQSGWQLKYQKFSVQWTVTTTTYTHLPNKNRKSLAPLSNNYTTHAPNGDCSIAAVADSNGTHEVLAVPPTTIPAWTEVQHLFFNDQLGGNNWVLDFDGYSGTDGYLAPNPAGNIVENGAMSANAFGGNYLPTITTGLGQAVLVEEAPDQPIEYMVPGAVPASGDVFETTDTAVTLYGAQVFDRAATVNLGVDFGSNVYVGNVVEYDNSYIYIEANTNIDTAQNDLYLYDNSIQANCTDIEYNLPPGEEMVGGQWYLLDVEFDETQGAGIIGTFDGTGGNGRIFIEGVVDYNAGYTVGNEVDPVDGTGLYHKEDFLYGEIGSVQLVPTVRTEYGMANGDGDEKTVLRAVFKYDENSYNFTTHQGSRFTIRVKHCTDGVFINKIIAKKLSDLTPGSTWDNYSSNNSSAGTATDWTITDTSSGDVSHAFDNRSVYFNSNKLVWGVEADDGGMYRWHQDFDTATTAPLSSLVYAAGGWQLTFTLSKNPNNLDFNGKLIGSVYSEDDNGNPIGMQFSILDIEDPACGEGNYIVRFNFDTDDSTWTIERSNFGAYNAITNPWVVITGGAVQGPFSNTLPGSQERKIQFTCDNTSSGNPQNFAVNDIGLNDNSIVYLGGSAGSWSFDGFNAAIDNYIYWDITEQNIVFNNCPPFDPTFPVLKFININQEIEQTINQFEHYLVKFEHGIEPGSTATLAVYYYNSNGLGFKISGITDTTPTPFEQVVVIGELDTNGNPVTGSVWNPINQVDPLFNANLKNSFVVEVEGAEDDVINGWIDIIEMKKVFTDNNFVDTTITFSEDVNGWTSFKDFIPENGVSVSRKYFTLKNAALYKHYVPLKYDDTTTNWIAGEIDSNTGVFVDYKAEEAENYNRFYESFSTSKIQAVLNQEPSIVKLFNTINYEGTQAYTKQPGANNPLTTNNSIAYNGDVAGWFCSEIQTDLDSGHIFEFVKKEGKWFNYIKGVNTNQAIDTSLFSVQGIGLMVEDTSGQRQAQTNNNNNTGQGQTTAPPPNTGNTSGGTTGGGGTMGGSGY